MADVYILILNHNIYAKNCSVTIPKTRKVYIKIPIIFLDNAA